MKYSLLLLSAALFIAACSQDNGNNKDDQLIKIEKKVQTTEGKDAALICLEEGDNITCKLMTKRLNEPRSVKFQWQSPISPDDDRAYTVTLPATHASVFDRRHKAGRAKGNWTVTAEMDGEEVSTTFDMD